MHDRYLTMPRDMSWLSPKRRRTTGNVPTTSGRKNSEAGSETALGSPWLEPTTPKNERPPSRAMSNGSSNGVPSLPGSSEGSRDGSGEGNLFYAYAKRVG